MDTKCNNKKKQVLPPVKPTFEELVESWLDDFKVMALVLDEIPMKEVQRFQKSELVTIAGLIRTIKQVRKSLNPIEKSPIEKLLREAIERGNVHHSLWSLPQ